ncbi:MAG: hypothetical protein RMH75_02475 [Archaeoglobaceae archaeon]|nr:hypothetical protein [Archaeoglobaceae archaeon]MDW7989521.1 hypothetical protein [Archaeoglobaceae archaeon]
MRCVEISLLILIVIFTSSAYEITVILRNFDDVAELRIFNSSGLFLELMVSSGDVLSLPSGEYTFELIALNKTFLKDIIIERDEVLDFNLGFTNSTDVLSITIHTVVFQDYKVEEIIIVSNTADVNFEGNLTIPIPEIKNLQIISSDFDFINAFALEHYLIFESLLIAENSSGSIRIVYILSNDFMEREIKGEKILIMPLVEVEDYKNLTKYSKKLGGNFVTVFEGNSSYFIKFRFLGQFPIVYLAIFTISTTVFLIFFGKRGRWQK